MSCIHSVWSCYCKLHQEVCDKPCSPLCKDYCNEQTAEGMRIVEQWFEEMAKENIPPKELTIADIEKQLGYKIKIVGEDR